MEHLSSRVFTEISWRRIHKLKLCEWLGCLVSWISWHLLKEKIPWPPWKFKEAELPHHNMKSPNVFFEGSKNLFVSGGHLHFCRWGVPSTSLGWVPLRHCKNRFTFVFHPGGSFRTAWNLSMALCVLYDPWLGAATVAQLVGYPKIVTDGVTWGP